MLSTKNLFIMLCSFLLMSHSFAMDEKPAGNPIDCVAELMSKPSCINRLNAVKICQRFGPTKDTVDYIQKCIVDEGFVAGTEIMAPKNIMVICLGGQIFGSSLAKDNETNCKKEDAKKSLGVSDTTLPKKVEIDPKEVEYKSIPK